MVIACSAGATFAYVCQAERELPKERQTVFRLRRLPASVGMALDNLHDAAIAGGHVTLRVGDQRIVTLRAGLAGWENLNDPEGRPVEFKAVTGDRVVFGIPLKNPCHETMIDLLPEEVAEELAAAIRTGNTMTATDAKN